MLSHWALVQDLANWQADSHRTQQKPSPGSRFQALPNRLIFACCFSKSLKSGCVVVTTTEEMDQKQNQQILIPKSYPLPRRSGIISPRRLPTYTGLELLGRRDVQAKLITK